MPIADRYLHSLVLQRATLGAADRAGHAEIEFLPENYVTFQGLMQERSGIEVAGPDLGGTIIANAVCFTAPALLPVERDQITHGDRMYEVLFVKDPGGIGHHLEILCRSIRSGQPGAGS